MFVPYLQERDQFGFLIDSEVVAKAPNRAHRDSVDLTLREKLSIRAANNRKNPLRMTT